jgi:hypothetical protein
MIYYLMIQLRPLDYRCVANSQNIKMVSIITAIYYNLFDF